jgi:hypothetical protein
VATAEDIAAFAVVLGSDAHVMSRTRFNCMGCHQK